MPLTRIRRVIPHRVLCLTVCIAPAFAQQTTTNPTVVKPSAFEVISIKPNNSGRQGGAWGVWKNEYSARNTPLIFIILEAYLGETHASTERLKSAPSWVVTDGYDVTAKADNATADSWKGLRQAQQVAIVAPMLRAMLEDRCKLVVHTVPTHIQGYALILSKRPLKLKQAQADEPRPAQGPYGIMEGGWMITYPKPGTDMTPFTGFRKVTMAQFTDFVSMGQAPIVDQTGLQGIYDFDLPRVDTTPAPAPDGAPAAAPPRLDAAHLFDWQSVGLELKPIQIPAVDIVIDHIERPAAN
jgi:uncharacterized protein (TIGR03435 family)